MTATNRDMEAELNLMRNRVRDLELHISRLEAENRRLEPSSTGAQPDLAVQARVLANLHSSLQELDQKQAVFNQIVDSMQDMILVKDRQSRIVYANRAFREFYGMSMDELAGIIDAPVNPEEWTNQYLVDDAYVINTGNTLTIDEEPCTRHDGTVRYFNTIKTAIFTSGSTLGDRQATLMVAVCRDITERKEVERRVNEFNSMVSHELRTPLTAIRAALGLIEGGLTEPISPTNMDLVQIARTECDRMIRLINDLLDIKKIAANKLDMNMVPLTPENIFEPVVASMSKIASECGITLVAQIQDTRSFLGDRDRIIQVTANLVSNAIKFSPSNTEVRLQTERRSDSVIRFAICDKGPGIAESDFDRLFIAFQQLDSSDSRAKGGTGLGLAISKAIVERHNGRIGFETELGQGTTFWFDLPVLRSADQMETPMALQQ